MAEVWMTISEAERRVAHVVSIAGDDENAHGAEDELREAVLEQIAQGHPHAAALARVALRTGDIEFSRWYA